MGGVFSCDLSDFPIFANVTFFTSEIFSRTAIYLFFMMAGYFFFFNTASRFSMTDYKNKLKNRVHSLLIPYVIWNVLVIFLFFFVQTLLSEMTSGNNVFVKDWSWKEWLSAFWAYDNGHPINGPFWFIRDLMAVCLFSLPLYYLLRGSKGLVVVIIMLFIWLLGIYTGIIGLNTDAFAFFSLGAYFSINRKDITVLCSKLFYPGIIVMLVTTTLQMWAFNHGEIGNVLIDRLVFFSVRLDFLAIMVIVINIATIFVERGLKTNKLLHDSNFFIYAYHLVALGFLSRCRERLYMPSNEIEGLLTYFQQPIIIIVLGVLIYYVAEKHLPVLTHIITGDRQIIQKND